MEKNMIGKYLRALRRRRGMSQQVPREYIDIIEKLMRCDIAERDAQ